MMHEFPRELDTLPITRQQIEIFIAGQIFLAESPAICWDTIRDYGEFGIHLSTHRNPARTGRLFFAIIPQPLFSGVYGYPENVPFNTQYDFLYLEYRLDSEPGKPIATLLMQITPDEQKVLQQFKTQREIPLSSQSPQRRILIQFMTKLYAFGITFENEALKEESAEFPFMQWKSPIKLMISEDKALYIIQMGIYQEKVFLLKFPGEQILHFQFREPYQNELFFALATGDGVLDYRTIDKLMLDLEIDIRRLDIPSIFNTSLSRLGIPLKVIAIPSRGWGIVSEREEAVAAYQRVKQSLQQRAQERLSSSRAYTFLQGSDRAVQINDVGTFSMTSIRAQNSEGVPVVLFQDESDKRFSLILEARSQQQLIAAIIQAGGALPYMCIKPNMGAELPYDTLIGLMKRINQQAGEQGVPIKVEAIKGIGIILRKTNGTLDGPTLYRRMADETLLQLHAITHDRGTEWYKVNGYGLLLINETHFKSEQKIVIIRNERQLFLLYLEGREQEQLLGLLIEHEGVLASSDWPHTGKIEQWRSLYLTTKNLRNRARLFLPRTVPFELVQWKKPTTILLPPRQ